jgi:hypothetical protein
MLARISAWRRLCGLFVAGWTLMACRALKARGGWLCARRRYGYRSGINHHDNFGGSGNRFANTWFAWLLGDGFAGFVFVF